VDNLFFFTGENEYALSKEVTRWRRAFVSKCGEENLLILKGREANLSTLLDAVGTMPFIAEKRLVLIEGVPKLDREDFDNFCERIHPQTVVAVIDPKPDKRLGIVKELEKKAETKRFKLLKPAELIEWMKAEARFLDTVLSETVAKALISIVGEDQWTLNSEIKKVALRAKGEITLSDIEILAVPSGSQVVWRLTDLIGNRKPLEALAFLNHRLERGEDVYGVWTILLNMIKNLALVAAAIESGIQGERAITDATGIHPFSVRGILVLARSMPIDRIRELVNWAAEADVQLKSGGYHYSAEHPEEVIALAERMILACS
jgi:DNA polymerase-3 subunit delta